MKEITIAEDLFESGASASKWKNSYYLPREWKKREYNVRKLILRKMEWYEIKRKFKQTNHLMFKCQTYSEDIHWFNDLLKYKVVEKGVNRLAINQQWGR